MPRLCLTPKLGPHASAIRFAFCPTGLALLLLAVALGGLTLAWPAPLIWASMLPLALSWVWAARLQAWAGMAHLAGGWLLALLLLLVLSSATALLGLSPWVLGVGMGLALLLGCWPQPPPPAAPAQQRTALLGLLAAGGLLLSLWGRSLWAAHAGDLQLPLWPDWFFHGRLLDMLAQSPTQAVHDLRGVELPLLPYHYLSYGLAAWLGAITGGSGLDLAWTVWWPLGMLLLLAAGAEWVQRLRPQAPVWMLSLPLLLFWPDAAELGSGQAFLSWHWLQIIAPGGLYGSAVMLGLSSWLYGRLQAPNRQRSLLLVLGGLALAMLFKAQVVLLAGPLLLLWWAGVAPSTPKQRWVWSLLLLGLGLLILRGPALPGLPLLHLGGGGWRDYWPALQQWQGPGWLQGWTHPAWAPLALWLGSLGWAALGLLAWPRAPQPVRYWLLLLPAGYLLFALGLDLDYRGGAGTPEELQHRPLVWLWPMWLLTSWAYLWPQRAGQTWGRALLQPGLAMLILALALGAGWRWGPRLQQGPRAQQVLNLPPGLRTVTAYVASHRQAGDLCQSADADPGFVWTALSQCPPYWVAFNLHPRSSAAVRARAEHWQQVQQLPPMARWAELRRLGVKWYSVGPEPGSRQAQPTPAAFARLPLASTLETTDGYVLYQLRP